MQVRLLIEMSLFSTESGSHPDPDPKHREHAQYSYGRESVHVHADNSFYTPLSGQTAVSWVIHDTATISENDSFQSESARDSSSGYWLGVTRHNLRTDGQHAHSSRRVVFQQDLVRISFDPQTRLYYPSVHRNCNQYFRFESEKIPAICRFLFLI